MPLPDDIADRLLFQCVTTGWVNGDTYHLQWAGGGYDAESVTVTEEEYSYIESLQDRYSRCHGCDGAIGEGEPVLEIRRTYSDGKVVFTSRYCGPCGQKRGTDA